MTAPKPRRARSRLALLLPVAVIAFGFLIGPVANSAQAQTDSCSIEQFIGADNEVDLTAYAACVAALNANATAASGLPRTGTDVGQYVGIGSALIALGAAFVWTARRNRQRVEA